MEIKSVPVSELNKYQESLLKKRKRDDFDQKRRNDARAKQKLDQGRQAKEKEKDNAGGNILMPEVFVSNHMKQQRNYVHLKEIKVILNFAPRLHRNSMLKITDMLLVLTQR